MAGSEELTLGFMEIPPRDYQAPEKPPQKKMEQGKEFISVLEGKNKFLVSLQNSLFFWTEQNIPECPCAWEAHFGLQHQHIHAFQYFS